VKLIDLTGVRFGRLVVKQRVEDGVRKSGQGYAVWECVCDCGTTKMVAGAELRNGKTNSCGCLARELASKRLKKYNRYEIFEDCCIGYTSKDEEFFVDAKHYDKIKDYCWFINNTGYCYAKIGSRHVLLHRLLHDLENLDLPIIDHIDGNKLNNRMSNLRIANDSINNMNKGLQKNNKSGCRGVIWHSRDSIWEAYISVGRTHIYLGRFLDYQDAVNARSIAEAKYFGEYARKVQ
jgi:hypothetical protein